MKGVDIPEGWELKKLGEILEFKNGINTDKDSYGKGTKFVNVMDIFKNNLLKENNIIGSVEITEKQLEDSSVIYGDILFNRTSEIAEEIAYSAVYIGREKITFGGFVIRGRQLGEYLNTAYSQSCFYVGTFRKEAIRRCQGVVRANIGQKDLSKIPILLPPLSEQEGIANILTSWDNGIQSLTKLIELKEKQKKGLMQKLLTGKTRLKGFTEPWVEKKLEEIFKEYSAKNFPHERLLSVTQDRGVIPRDMLEGRVMSPEGSLNGYKIIEQGDFVISLRSFQGGFEYSNYRGILSPAYTILRNIFEINKHFFYYFFKSYIFIKRHLSSVVVGIRDGKSISYRDISTIKILLPSLLEQEAISQILCTADEEISLLKGKLALYKKQKEALMQQLLTGKRRVKV